MGNIGVDMILGRSSREIGRAFAAFDRPPRVERTSFLAHLAGIGTRGVEPVYPPFEHGPGDLRAEEDKSGQNVAVGIPEDMAFIAFAGLTLGADRGRTVAPDRLDKLEQRVSQR